MQNRSIKPQKVGALWGRTDRNGQDYLTGKVGDKERERKIKVFKNKKRKKSDPDFIIISTE